MHDALGNVPDTLGQKLAIGAEHCCALERPFHTQNMTAKPPSHVISATFYRRFNSLRWSDPEAVEPFFTRS
jgi:hypothetical protein